MSPYILVIAFIGVGALCILIGYILRKNLGEKTIGSAEQQARNMILDAQNKSDTIRKEVELEAKEEAHRIRNDVDREIRDRRNEIQRQERRIQQ